MSRFLEITPVRGKLEVHCQYGAPWRIDQGEAAAGEMPYHIVLDGSGLLEDPAGGPPIPLAAGDILLIANGDAHVLHDGSGKRAKPAMRRTAANLVFSENKGRGAQLDMLCGRFVLSPSHAQLLRGYLPPFLVVHAAGDVSDDARETGAQLWGLMALMRAESGIDCLGGRAMLNALSTALFALVLRFASKASEAPAGLLALAGYPRLAPALESLFQDPGAAWTLPVLARKCNMSRSSFVRLFQEKLGRSASELLTDIRMTLAANQLRESSLSTGAIAESAGYQSEAAFQRAFKLHLGVTPAHWRRAAQVQDSVP
ncbi:AraC family transcriptional regulator [Dyella sp. C11]|uniref:AraC family transcriptional regulator n=1 Tax=Dyella sp. C11 TaxID=2126991 RepID=UPI001E50091B|nr:AraC family transcriptional regulator [Dyella sp. C11]